MLLPRSFRSIFQFTKVCWRGAFSGTGRQVPADRKAFTHPCIHASIHSCIQPFMNPFIHASVHAQSPATPLCLARPVPESAPGQEMPFSENAPRQQTPSNGSAMACSPLLKALKFYAICSGHLAKFAFGDGPPRSKRIGKAGEGHWAGEVRFRGRASKCQRIGRNSALTRKLEVPLQIAA